MQYHVPYPTIFTILIAKTGDCIAPNFFYLKLNLVYFLFAFAIFEIIDGNFL
jgi:hypothetical protein